MKSVIFENIHPFVRDVNFHKPDNTVQASYDNLFAYAYRGAVLASADGICYTLERGDVLIIRPGVPYSFSPRGDACSLILIDFDYTGKMANTSYRKLCDSAETFNRKKIIETVTISNAAAFNRTVHVRGVQLSEEKIIEIANELHNRGIYSRMKANALLLSVLAEIARRLKLDVSGDGYNTESVGEILKYICEHACENLTNRDVGKRFAMHPNYVNALVKSKTGYTLHHYLLTRRLARALELLDGTSLPIYEVAEKCGFNDSKNFTRYFKKSVGITPRRYRNRD